MAEAKPKKQKIEKYVFDGVTVELRQVAPDKRNAKPGTHMEGPAQRSKWEVHIGDTHLGFAFYPLGVANPWIGTTLEPQDLTNYDGLDGVRCWKGPTGEYGGWGETGGMWDGLLGLLKRVEAPTDLKQRSNSTYGFRDRAGVADGFARAYKAGKLPDTAGVNRKIATRRQEIADRKREDAERTARYTRERAESAAQQKRDAEAAEALRLETLEGLVSIRDRLGTQISNMELVALGRAIDRYSN